MMVSKTQRRQTTALLAIMAMMTATTVLAEPTKLHTLTEADLKTNRRDMVLLLNKESQVMPRDIDAVQGGEDAADTVDVLYKPSVQMFGREYTFEHNPELHHQCDFSELLRKTDKQVYRHVREMTPKENKLHWNEGKSPATNHHIVGARETDVLLKIGHEDDDVDRPRYSIVRPINTTYFSCPDAAECCGLRCCPTALRTFLERNARKQILPYGLEWTMELSVTRHVNATDNPRNCEYKIGQPFQHYRFSNPGFVDTVYYKCPRNYSCCTMTLCCVNRVPPVPKKTFTSWIAGIKNILIGIFIVCGLLFVASLWYCCHYRPHNRPTPHTYLAPVKRSSQRQSRPSESIMRASVSHPRASESHH